MKPNTITTKIYQKIFELLEKNPEGLRWVDLRRELGSSGEFHPKTVNGLIWKLPEKFPDKVYKPRRGMFRLTKFRENPSAKW